MRSVQEMLELIIGTARQDDRVRAVILNGSRANPNAPRDPFQDFDVVYLVQDISPFWHNLEWIERFGERMILQMPELMQDPPPNRDGSFSYLMQFSDGNRIDLTIAPLANLEQFTRDSLTEILLDKDARIQYLPPASERDYFPQPPSPQAFGDCCNEFWWICPYIAKGLWRGEILYARHFLDYSLRDQLLKMLTWYAGIRTGFSRSLGKNGKYLQGQLEPGIWQRLLDTYCDADYEHTWQALFAACELFREVAMVVAEKLDLDYPLADDHQVSAYLNHIRCLPGNANEIY